MAEEREVVARLKVQKEGDTGAFKEVATDLEGLAAPAASATEAMGAFFEKLRDPAIEQGPDALNEIEQAMKRVTDAADEFAKAEGPKEQLESVKALEEAWVAFGDQFSSQIGQSIELSSQFEAALEEIRKKGADATDPIVSGLKDLEAQLQKLDGSAEKGFFGFDRGAASAVSTIKNLKQEIASAEAQGRDIGEGARESLAGLEKQLHETISAAGKFRNTQADVRQEMKEVRSETDLGRGSINDLGDIFERMSPKISKFIGTAAGIAGALYAGYEAGTKLREGLNWLTDGDFDQGVQGLISKVLQLDDGLDSNADAAQNLANGMRILKANGIDPVGLSAAEVAKKVAELAKAKNDAAKASEDLAAAEEDWAAKLGLSGKALDESSKKLATYVADFAKQNQQLSQTDLAKIFGPMIQEVLDGYARLGKEAPAEVRKLADGWGILTTAAQKAANEQKKIVDDMVADITGAASKLKGNLQEQLGTLSEVFSKIDFGSLGAEQIDKAKKFLEDYVATSRKAGQQIPQDVADQAASMGILVSAMEVASEANKGLRGTEAELKEVVFGTTQTFNAQGQELSKLTTISNQAGAASKAAGSQIKEGAESIDEAGEPIRNVTGEVQALVDGLRGAASTAKTAGAGVKEGAEQAGEGAASLKEAGKAGEEAGTGIASAKTAAEGLGTAAGAGKTGVDGLKTSLDGVGEKAGAAATGIQSMNAVDLVKIDSGLAGILAKLDQIPAKAAAAKAALDQIDEAG